ncbi:MAG TPA: CTP synthase [Candidatus Saccharimonadales bacterium]|nr:CTP synthase [Candidatus Saccharimonadales bacterium]
MFVTGGVLSGLGKGITAASIGNLLRARGLKVNIQKCDPYLNVDAGTLNPREHGECFVTKDGAEADLDLGHYERFLDEELTTKSSLMSGKVLLKVIQDEREGKYQGKSVQIIPQVTSAIQDYIQDAAQGSDVHIVEIGGTVGDYESLSFIEAIRELSLRVGSEHCAYVHVVYLPYLGTSKEIKSKPAQNSVRDLRGLGITPDILVARSEEPTNPNIKEKLSLFSGVNKEAIALLPNASTIYEVPLTLEKDGIGRALCRRLKLKDSKPKLSAWEEVVTRATTKHSKRIKIGIVAKYLDNQDTYMSVFEALRSAGWWNNVNVQIIWISAEKLLTNAVASRELSRVDGIVVPGGFGDRGIEGMIKAAQVALTKKIPYLGLCLGLHVAVIGGARKAGLSLANSAEFDSSSPDKVIDTMPDQKGKENTGGSMRLGNYPCILDKDSLTAKLYRGTKIVERHRHRYECNNDYVDRYESWGFKTVGVSPDGNLVEVIEGINHPFFIASQYHPEFKSRPNRPHPLFNGFVVSLLQKNLK